MLRSAFFIILWYVPNILTVCLKYIFQYLGFTFPLTLTAIHMLFSGLGAAIVLHLIGNPPLIKLDASHVLQRVFPLSFLFCLNIVLGNKHSLGPCVFHANSEVFCTSFCSSSAIHIISPTQPASSRSTHLLINDSHRWWRLPCNWNRSEL